MAIIVGYSQLDTNWEHDGDCRSSDTGRHYIRIRMPVLRVTRTEVCAGLSTSQLRHDGAHCGVGA
jgi:hypothetical protein